MSSPRVVCDRCHAIVPREGHYVVTIEVYAEPSAPEVSGADLEETDHAAKMSEQMRHTSAEELEDSVYKRFDFRLCRACQRSYLKRPLPPE